MSPRVNPFDQGAAGARAYDAWYDSRQGRAILEHELHGVAKLLHGAPHPWLDLGTGSGRFGAGVGADIGLDPAPELLRLAARRMPSLVRGIGEALPFRDQCLGAVLAVTVLEFLPDPQTVISQAARALRPGGRMVLGFFPRGGGWARFYEDHGRRADSAFRNARFLSIEDVGELGVRAGCALGRVQSALFEDPRTIPSRPTVDGWKPDAGFVAAELVKPAGPEE